MDLSDLQGDTWFRADRLSKCAQRLSKCPHLPNMILSYIQFEKILEPNTMDLLLRGGKCVPRTCVSGEIHFVMILPPKSIGRALFFF